MHYGKQILILVIYSSKYLSIFIAKIAQPLLLTVFLLLSGAGHSIAQNCPTNSTDTLIYTLGGTAPNVTITAVDLTTGGISAVDTLPAAGQGGSPNAIGWSVSQKKFYYFANSGSTDLTGSGLKFASYDPVTHVATQLAVPTPAPGGNDASSGSTSFTRGVVTSDGNGFYALSEESVLYYYNILNNTWTTITSTILDQNGNNVSNQWYGTQSPYAPHERSGDIAMDGNGNLWILTSQYGSSTPPATHSLYKLSAPLPTTAQANVTVVLLSQGVLNPGNYSFTGIAFNRSGQIYLGSPNAAGGIYRLNNDFSLTQIVTGISGGGDLGSCALPLTAFPQNITGNVFHDSNGMSDTTVNGTGTNIGGVLFAMLIDQNNGKVVAQTAVSNTGAYAFPNTSAGLYTIAITTNSATVGSTPPAIALPAGWVNTGEFVGAGKGTDSLPDGKLTVLVAGAPVSNADFGVEQTPTSYNRTYNVSGQPVVNVPVNLGSVPMQGSDPEDMPSQANWNNKDIVINATPTNGFVLTYNGTVIKAGDTIKNYNPSLLTIKATSGTPAGTQNTVFKYSVLDAAKQISTPATYTVQFSQPLPVALVAFHAEAVVNCDVAVNWETAIEANMNRFVLERSRDAIKYMPIATIPANGNNSKYKYMDAQAANGNNLYRLMMIDNDSKETYSSVVNVYTNCPDDGAVKIYPTVSSLYVNIAALPGNALIRIYSDMGALVLQAKADSSYITLDVQSLPSGTYMVQVISETGQITSKIVKQ